jgi:hypothetical protein
VRFLLTSLRHVLLASTRTFYKADFLCYGSIIVELKALSALDSAHVAQLITYVKATGNSDEILALVTKKTNHRCIGNRAVYNASLQTGARACGVKPARRVQGPIAPRDPASSHGTGREARWSVLAVTKLINTH